MSNPFNFSDEQIEQLLQNVSNQMGIEKSTLKQKLMNNDVDFLLNNSKISNKTAMLKILNDPSLLQKFMEYQKYRSKLDGRGE